MQFLPEPLLPITSSIPPHLDLFENQEVVVNLPNQKTADVEAAPEDWQNTTGWEDVDDQIGTKRTYKRKYRPNHKPKNKTNTTARRKNKRSRQTVDSLPPSPPDSQLYISNGWEKAYEAARFTGRFTGWESGWSENKWAASPTGWSNVDKAEKPTGWSDGWSDVDEADKASGWDVVPSHKHDRWTQKPDTEQQQPSDDQPERPHGSWATHDPFPEASVPAFWTSLSRVWLTDYAVHELSCQIAIQSGKATARAPFKRPTRVPEGAVDEWAFNEVPYGGEGEYYPVDWNQEQACLDRDGRSYWLDVEKAEELVGRDRLEELTEPDVGQSCVGFDEYGALGEERRWWEVAEGKRLEVSLKNIEACRMEGEVVNR